MAIFAATLQEIATRDIDVPVVDHSALAGAFDFDLSWAPSPGPQVAAAGDPPEGPALFDAIEQQLGLRLQRTRLPLPVIVVDSVERTPRGN